MKFNKLCLQTMTLTALIFGVLSDDRVPKKRQIYREQVLPHAGGRIPDTAFETDRLFLNRLQKEGIAIPDGVVPEQRTPQVYQYYNKSPRTVFRIALSSDARYTPNEGKYHYKDLPSVETTYLYPQVHGQNVVLTPPTPAYPIYKQFQLHNPQLNQVKLQAKKKPSFVPSGPKISSYKTASKGHSESYQNFNLLNIPLRPLSSKATAARNGKNLYLPSYQTTHIFNDFDDIFSKFDLHETHGPYY